MRFEIFRFLGAEHRVRVEKDRSGSGLTFGLHGTDERREIMRLRWAHQNHGPFRHEAVLFKKG